MLQADFCGSPPGWNGGDSDRYLPAILLGCIPVFFSKREFRPFEEILDWDQFSLRVSKHEIPKLHEIIGNISSAKVVKMRRAMAQAWERLLFSSYTPSHESLGNLRDFGFSPGMNAKLPNITSYLGEDGRHDAFEGVMAVLRDRVRAWS